VDDLEKEIIQINQNQEQLLKNYNELVELKFVLTKDADFFYEVSNLGAETKSNKTDTRKQRNTK
jgi:hypothetical protein